MHLPIQQGIAKQYIVSTAVVLVTAMLCYTFNNYITYHITALLLLVTVCIIAAVYDIYPVLLAALLSAAILNFVFIPPLFTFHIHTAEDLLMLLVFIIIAIVNAVFTFKIKKEQQKTREKEDRKNTLALYNTLFNSLSHELKTPIATIIGATGTLQQEGLPDEYKISLVTQIDHAATRLNKQVENLLNMSRLESGMLKVNKDWCDAAEMIYSVLQKTEAGTHTIIFDDIEKLPLFKFDTGLIEQAVYNIVHNAVLYTPDDSIITLSVTYREPDCIITISDNGIGFPQEALTHIFTKFYRLPNAKAGGTGLGLSIAKGFIEAHGGTITVANNAAGGAVFKISFPCEVSYINHLKNE